MTTLLRTDLLAGHAIFTVSNVKTGNRFTYKVTECDDKPGLYFVNVLTGADNTSDYAYLGTVRSGQYAHGRKSRITEDALSAKAFTYVWNHLDGLPPCVEVHHAGRCLRCGRMLTVPESIEMAYGPECAKKVAGAA